MLLLIYLATNISFRWFTYMITWYSITNYFCNCFWLAAPVCIIAFRKIGFLSGFQTKQRGFTFVFFLLSQVFLNVFFNNFQSCWKWCWFGWEKFCIVINLRFWNSPIQLALFLLKTGFYRVISNDSVNFCAKFAPFDV